MKYKPGDIIRITKLAVSSCGKKVMNDKILNTHAKVRYIDGDSYILALEIYEFNSYNPWKIEFADTHSELCPAMSILFDNNNKDIKKGL